ncbi:MAG: trypsin-like peptidase domain-containing protein [Bacteriovoracaceae bacterium]|nr:trypsin-like peptidase domain-containing protein [Bacteriovoracaceae bacterium]
MKYYIVFLTLISVSTAFAVTPNAIYGKDDRVEVIDYPNAAVRDLARAVAVQMSPDNLSTMDGSNKFYGLESKTLKEEYNLCDGVRFENQPSVGRCTGFLISSTKLVTAGHCAYSQEDCKDMFWVFDYQTNKNKTPISIQQKNIYQCKQVLKIKMTKEGKDFAVIELARPVTDRPYFKTASSFSSITKNTPVLTIGNPLGLPTKIADNGVITDTSHSEMLRTNLDTFQGASGSPVLNAKTLEVIGILIGGAIDHVQTAEGCDKPIIYQTVGKEKISRIKQIYSYF